MSEEVLKISEKELKLLRMRQMICEQKSLEFTICKNEMNQFIGLLLGSYKCERNGKFTIDLEDGSIIEQEAPTEQEIVDEVKKTVEEIENKK